MASLITKRFSVLPSLTKYFLQKSSSKSLSSTSFLLQQAKVQHPAPEFKGQAVVDGQFKEVSLSDFKGKWLVLFFYPLDFTFVRNPTLLIYHSYYLLTVCNALPFYRSQNVLCWSKLFVPAQKFDCI